MGQEPADGVLLDGLLVTESVLPADVLQALARWRVIVPTENWSDGRPPASLETCFPGIVAARDVRAASIKRVDATTGEGAPVVPLVHPRLDSLRRPGARW